MSDELGREELLEKVEELFNYYMEMNLKFLEGDELSKFKQAYEQIKASIQKPEVTEEWIGKKAIKLQETTVFLETESNRLKFSISWEKAKDFIRSLAEAIPAKKPTVPKGFVEKWGRKLNPHRINDFEQMLKEAGVEER